MITTSASVPVIREGHGGECRWFYGGGVHTWKVTADETGGAFMLFEDRMERGKVTPLHTHPSVETMYVLEGEVLMHMDGQEHRIEPGGVAVAPAGVPHAFMVVSDIARLLCLHTPGCCQQFYWDASEPMSDDDTAPRPVDFDKVRASAQRNGGIELLGPPPFTHTPPTYGS